MNDTDLDELLDQPPMPGPKECWICWACRSSDGDTATKLAAVAARTDIPWQKVADAINYRFPQINPGADSIQRHRRLKHV